MMLRPDVLVAILAMAAVTFACRAGGFVLMRFVALTPRVRAWLRAIPIALMGAILAPIAVHGGIPEWLGLAVAATAMRFSGSELLATVAAMAVVAGGRALLG